MTNSVYSNPRNEKGSTLVFVLIFLLLVSLIAMSIVFTTEVEFRTSVAFQDQHAALSNTDSAINEVFWRFLPE